MTESDKRRNQPARNGPIGLLGIICVILSMALCVAVSAGTAWGKVKTGRDTGVAPNKNESNTERIGEYTFTDESSGVILKFSPNGGQSARNVTNSIESLDLRKGKECLHKEGTCDACDELRSMYDSGEVDELCRVTVEPEVNVAGQYGVLVPLTSNQIKYTCYRCDNGALKQVGKYPVRLSAGGNTSYAPIYGDIDDVQSPIGIAYGKGNSSKTDQISVHAYTPDDSRKATDNKISWITKVINKILDLTEHSE